MRLPVWNKDVDNVDERDEGVTGEVLQVEGVQARLVEEWPVHQRTHCKQQSVMLPQ